MNDLDEFFNDVLVFGIEKIDLSKYRFDELEKDYELNTIPSHPFYRRDWATYLNAKYLMGVTHGMLIGPKVRDTVAYRAFIQLGKALK